MPINILKYKKIVLANKNSIKDTNIVLYNNKQILNFINYYNYLKQALKLKNIYLDTASFSSVGKNLSVTLNIYFSALKVSLLKKRGKINYKGQKNRYFLHSKNSLFPSHFVVFNQLNNAVIKFYNINSTINIKKSLSLYAKLKSSIFSLLKKRRYLLIDFIRIITLITENKASGKLFAGIISQIFSTLSKKSHNRFFLILKKVFKIIILENQLPQNTLKIEGIKLKISGRIRGKTRSDIRVITVGSVPLQTESKHIEFFKQHIYTLYGAFGLKLWIYRSSISLT